MTTPSGPILGISDISSQAVSLDLASLGLTSFLSEQIRDRIAAAEATKNQVLDFELLPAPPAAMPSGETISREEALAPILLELYGIDGIDDGIDALESGLGSDVLPITDLASEGAIDLLLGGGDSGQAGMEGNVSFFPSNGLSTVDVSNVSLEDFALVADCASSFISGSLDLDVSAADPLLSDMGLTSVEVPLLNQGLLNLIY